MSTYSSESSSSEYETGKEPHHRHHRAIYDEHGNIIRETQRNDVGNYNQERERSSIDKEGKHTRRHEYQQVVRASRPPRPSDFAHPPSDPPDPADRSWGNQRNSVDKAKFNGGQERSRRRSSNEEKAHEAHRVRRYSGDSDRRRFSGQREEHRRGSDDDPRNGAEARETSTAGKDVSQDRNLKIPLSDAEEDKNHRHHRHHRVHHHRHYKKLLFYWPFGGKHETVNQEGGEFNEQREEYCNGINQDTGELEGLSAEAERRERRSFDDPSPKSCEGNRKVSGGERGSYDHPSSELIGGDRSNEHDASRCRSKRRLTADHTTSVSRIFKPNMNDRDVAIALEEEDINDKGRKTRFGRTGFAADNSVSDTDEGSFHYEDVQDAPPLVAGSDCPFCGQGKFKLKFTWTGIIAGILLFPCGIYCCFKCRVRVCTYCGASPL